MKAILVMLISGLGLLLLLLYWGFKRLILPRIIEIIASKKSLPFFPNGLATTLKESRHLRTSMNAAFDKFVIYSPGSDYLGNYLPEKKDWPVESTKWFLTENAGTTDVINRIANNLETKYGRFSIKLTKEEKQILLEHKGFTITEKMTDWQKYCWSYGIFWYGSWSGQEQINYKEITFATRAERGNDIVWHPKEKSPYYFGSFVEYGFQVTDQEDIDNVRLKVTFTISGKNINPHVSDIDNANVFERMYSMVEARAGDVVKENSFHLLHEKVAAAIANAPDDHRAKMKQNVSDIREVFQAKIIAMLNEPDNFIGFEWGPDSVNILQIEAVGEESKKLLAKIIEALEIKFTNQIALDKNVNANTIKVNDAEADKNVVIKKSEGEMVAAKNKAQGKADAIKIETNAAIKAISKFSNDDAKALLAKLQAAIISGSDPNLILTGEALSRLQLNGLGITNVNLNEVIQLLTKKTTES